MIRSTSMKPLGIPVLDINDQSPNSNTHALLSTHTRTRTHTQSAQRVRVRDRERKERGVLKMSGSCGPRLISGYEAKAHLVCCAGPPSGDSPVVQMDIGSCEWKKFCSSGCGVLS